MGFADEYLLKSGLRDQLIQSAPHPDLQIAVTIPVCNESGLKRCLDSLFWSALEFSSQGREKTNSVHVEVIILINAPEGTAAEILTQNENSFRAAQSWIDQHKHPDIMFHLLLDHSFSKKEAGVGLARKILMDEAARRFSQVERRRGIIASMDADAVVEKNYLSSLAGHFEETLCDGASIYFEHPLGTESSISLFQDESFPPEVYEAIVQYELHLRYYLQSIRSTGYPYAFHTVGSSFAVSAEVYCMEGGMNRRQGGEDFYFIQKVAQRGNFSECNQTCVVPSPRPSDRVPFGTGPVVSRLLAKKEELLSYHPRPFEMIRQLFSQIDQMYKGEALELHFDAKDSMLQRWLETQQFSLTLEEIRDNSASLPAFQKRFWRWFNMFRIMKFLHFARENGFPDIPVGKAALELLRKIRPEGITLPDDISENRSLLLMYRELDRGDRVQE